MTLLTLMLACAGSGSSIDTAAMSSEPTWTNDIEPMYQTYCIQCHRRDGVMAWGVALDSYEAARSTRVRSACTSVDPSVIEAFGDALLPRAGHGSPVPCEGWEPLSMPPGARLPLPPEDQVLLARWVEIGAPR